MQIETDDHNQPQDKKLQGQQDAKRSIKGNLFEIVKAVCLIIIMLGIWGLGIGLTVGCHASAPWVLIISIPLIMIGLIGDFVGLAYLGQSIKVTGKSMTDSFDNWHENRSLKK